MKKVSLHRAVRREVSEVIRYLDAKAGEPTGDAFFAEAMAVFENLQTQHAHHFYRGDVGRVNLKRFPYHVLYRVHPSTVRVLAIRHHHRHPDRGMGRW